MPVQKYTKNGFTTNPILKNSVDFTRISLEEECKQQQFVIKKNSQIVNK